LFRQILDRVNPLHRDGRLVDRRDPFVNTRVLTTEIAVCDAAPRAVADLEFASSRPVVVAARLLLLHARKAKNQRDPRIATAVGEALIGLTPEIPEDSYDVARQLARFVAELDASDQVSEAWPERQSLRDRCANRGVDLLRQAVNRGLRDSTLLESAELTPFHYVPDYQALLAGLKSQSSGRTGQVKAPQ
jgi:hypothetical protein